MKVQVSLPQDSDLDRDLDGKDLADLAQNPDATAADIWEIAFRFGK